MKSTLLGRRALMGAMAIALMTGVNVKTFAVENLSNQVKERGILRVDLEDIYPPSNSQGDGGKLTRFEVEFADELTKHPGVKADLKLTKRDGMLASLNSERTDVVINQVAISDGRRKKCGFSTPHAISGVQASVRKGNGGVIKAAVDLRGKKIGVEPGINYEEWLHQSVQGADVRIYDNDPTKYQDLRVGHIDATLVDRLAALDLVKETDNTLAVTDEAFSRQGVNVALREGNDGPLKTIDAVIADMQKDDTPKTLSKK